MQIQRTDIVEVLVEQTPFGAMLLRVSGQDIIDKFYNPEKVKKSKKIRDGLFDGRGVAHLHRALCNFGIHTSGKPVDLEQMASNVSDALDNGFGLDFSEKTIEHLEGIKRILSAGGPFVTEFITSATTGNLFNMIEAILKEKQK